MSAENGRMKLYLADIRPLYQENVRKRAYALVDEARRAKADACRQEKGIAASLAAGLLADYALRAEGYADCCVAYEPEGRPKVVRAAGTKPVYVSLSHSGDYAVCAVADRPVGVDIQKRETVRMGMLRHFFTQEETQAFLVRYGLNGEDARKGILPKMAADEFFRLWTVKESYMKLTGEGMAEGFANIRVELACGRAWAEGKDAASVREYRVKEDYFLSACLAEKQGIGI